MNRIVAIALLAGAFTTGSCAKANAQSAVIEVSVPFDFTIKNTILPAGTYTFGWDFTYPEVLIIRNRTNSVEAKYLGERGSIGPGKPHSLIFRGYDGHYFLSEVRFASASNGIFLPAAKSEKQTRKANRNQNLASISVP